MCCVKSNGNTTGALFIPMSEDVMLGWIPCYIKISDLVCATRQKTFYKVDCYCESMEQLSIKT